MNILIIGSEGSIGNSIKEFFFKKKKIKKIYCIDKNVPQSTNSKIVLKLMCH